MICRLNEPMQALKMPLFSSFTILCLRPFTRGLRAHPHQAGGTVSPKGAPVPGTWRGYRCSGLVLKLANLWAAGLAGVKVCGAGTSNVQGMIGRRANRREHAFASESMAPGYP